MSHRVVHMHPFPPAVFVPRKKYTFKIVNHFYRNRVVVVKGVAGVGKAAVAQWTCEWLKWESSFSDGIFWVDCACDAFARVAATLAAGGPNKRYLYRTNRTVNTTQKTSRK